jgi:hypothetical protein
LGAARAGIAALKRVFLHRTNAYKTSDGISATTRRATILGPVSVLTHTEMAAALRPVNARLSEWTLRRRGDLAFATKTSGFRKAGSPRIAHERWRVALRHRMSRSGSAFAVFSTVCARCVVAVILFSPFLAKLSQITPRLMNDRTPPPRFSRAASSFAALAWAWVRSDWPASLAPKVWDLRRGRGLHQSRSLPTRRTLRPPPSG